MGDWAVAAVRAGDFQRILRLAPPHLGRADVFCAQAHALHMAGVDLDLDAVMREFRPNEVCWGMLDQLWADDALPWSQLQQMLRGALEQGKTTQARRTAALMFNGKQMQEYNTPMDNPSTWL